MALDNLQPLTYGIISIFFAIGTISFFIRFYCRMMLTGAFGWDDTLAIFLLIVNTMQQTILYIFLHYGCGIHAVNLTTYQLEKISLWLLVEEIFYMLTHWTIKMTFLIFYLRLSPVSTFRRCCFATIGLNTACMITNWLLALLQCIPLDAYFHASAYPEATCINSNITLLGPSVLNMITDVVILVLPLHTIWKLNMPRRKKISVTAVIAFGASSVIVAACRFIVLYQLGSTSDISYTLGHMVIVAAIEIQLAIIAVNMPSMKVLFTRTKMAGFSSERYEPGHPNSDGYKLSSMDRNAPGKERYRNDWAAPAVDISITRHIASDSEEELWKKEHRDQMHITQTFAIESHTSS